MLPVLYSFRRCPYAMRARLALRVAGIALEIREVVLKNKPPALLAASPKATVPVLVLPDGLIIEQSLDIMVWALTECDPEGWLSQGDPVRVQQLIAINDGPFKAALDGYKYPERHPQATRKQHRAQALTLQLEPLEVLLATGPWLLGPSPSLADMALFPFVRQFAQVDRAWWAEAGLPRLDDWLQRLAASPLFESVMHKLPPWNDGDDPRRF
ncbi:MAG: glutathione S-transferase [Burkholderiaceae bacterium]|nr:glutathione S-transferase [Burkholderiaceae bacterium]